MLSLIAFIHMKKKMNKNEIRARDVDPCRPIYSISIVNTAHLVRDGRLPPPSSQESNYSNRRDDRRQQTAFSFSRCVKKSHGLSSAINN